MNTTLISLSFAPGMAPELIAQGYYIAMTKVLTARIRMISIDLHRLLLK